MNLPFLKKFAKKKLPHYFLVLILRDEKAEAVIFEELDGKANVVGSHQQHFPDSVDFVSTDELLETLDKAISTAEESLPENIQTQKTIFGLKESWTENDQIKKEFLVKLKKASEELNLTPIGFLVISQAISHLLQKEEGVPVSAILTEVNKKSVTVTLLRAGKIIESKSSEIHDSIPFTVDTLLKHFNTAEILPSRIIVFNGKEDLSQEFISHAWSKSLPFLHLPQITSLPFGFDERAVLFGAASQLGFEVIDGNLPKRKIISSSEEPEVSTEPKEKEKLQEEKLEESTENYEENFGFLQDIDIAKMPPKKEEKHTKKTTQKKEEPEDLTNFSTVNEKDYIETDIRQTPRTPINFHNTLAFLKKALALIVGIIAVGFKKTNFKGFSFATGKFKLTIIGIVIFLITIFASYFFFLKATVEITVDPKILEQNQDILFSTTEDSNVEEDLLKGAFITVSEEGSVSTQTTGKKDVGTSAKGTVTIFSTLSQNKTLTEGTKIKSPQGLDFTLDQAITIGAVATHSADEPVNPSKTTVNVTASQLGKESNLPSGTKFTIGSYDPSDLIAKNDNPFSGGTKKEVTVVSQNDTNKLETELIKQLETSALENLQRQIGNSKILLPKLISENLGTKNLNAKIGDETNQVTLTGNVEYTGLSYDKNDLISYSKKLLSKDIPSNQELDSKNIKTTVLNIDNSDEENVKANLNIKALLLPKINSIDLTKQLKGKSFKWTEDGIYKLSSQIANVTIKLSPNLPFLPKTLPARDQNINIVVKLND